MKEGIHPNYKESNVTCNCGNTFVTSSTKGDIHVEICSKCHAFYTGQQKSARADGRIDKFNKTSDELNGHNLAVGYTFSTTTPSLL